MLSLVLAASAATVFSPPPKAEMPVVIDQVVLAPIFYRPFSCTEHPEGQLPYAGDALGTDCLVVGGMQEPGFMRLYRGDGSRNEDWYGWRAEVHAPLAGEIVAILVNPVTNTPGHTGKPPASLVAIRAADGTVVVLAHLQEIRVQTGQRVAVGTVIALDGNNGFARSPHVHVGAYRGATPLQIRWDLRVAGKIPGWYN